MFAALSLATLLRFAFKQLDVLIETAFAPMGPFAILGYFANSILVFRIASAAAPVFSNLAIL